MALANSNYEAYGHVTESSYGEVIENEDGTCTFQKTSTYQINVENKALLLADLQLQRDNLAAKDIQAEISELDSRISEISDIAES